MKQLILLALTGLCLHSSAQDIIFTDNPNDPRINLYRDSARNYVSYKLFTAAMIKAFKSAKTLDEFYDARDSLNIAANRIPGKRTNTVGLYEYPGGSVIIAYNEAPELSHLYQTVTYIQPVQPYLYRPAGEKCFRRDLLPQEGYGTEIYSSNGRILYYINR